MWHQRFRVAKVDEAKRQIFGYSSSSVLDGRLVTDHDSDTIRPEELERAAYDFALARKSMGTQHKRLGTGRLIESLVTTPEKSEALGIGTSDVRWWMGFQVDDDETWEGVRKGRYTEFSIAGEADRVPLGDGRYDLRNLRIDEVSVVDKGAGIGVPVAVFKRRHKETDMKLNKAWTAVLDRLTDDETRERLRAALETTESLRKRQPKTLEDLKAALEGMPGMIEALMRAIDFSAAAAQPATPPAGDDPTKMDDPSTKMDGPDPEEGAMARKDRDEVAKLRKQLEKQDAELAKMRHRVRKEAATQRVRKDYAHLPGSEDVLVEIELACEAIAEADGSIVDLRKELAESIRETLRKASTLIKESSAMHPTGSVRLGDDGNVEVLEGRTDAERELRGIAKRIQTADPSVTWTKAFAKACTDHPDLYKRHREAALRA